MGEEMERTQYNTNHGNSVKMELTTHQNTSKLNNTVPDLISALPDSLLLHILSLLDMDEVMKTSLLSKRWTYLWKAIPCLCFESLRDFPGAEYTNFIDRCLFHHEGSKIHKLRIRLKYKNTHAPLVDSWIRFAIKCEIEDLEFEFYGRYKFYELPSALYRLPCSLYKCTTLTSLSLCRCTLNLPDSFLLGSLKTLTLELIDLLPDSIERFSSSCPLLEEIYLIDCNKDRDLINIVITNEHVKRLEIYNYGGYGSKTVKINAPTLLTLKIYRCHPTMRFHVEQLGSLMSVDVVCDSVILGYSKDALKEIINHVEKLLNDLRHVKNLKLCGLYVQILSLRMVQSSDIFPISATCLELNTSLKRWVLPGISYLLESCSNLQKLKIVNGNCYDDIPAYWNWKSDGELINGHDFEEEEYWESFGTDVQPSIMQNIKTIEIDFKGESCHEEFIRFLLKNVKVLDRMVINTPKKYANNFELLLRLSQRTNAFPRSSPNAKLFIT